MGSIYHSALAFTQQRPGDEDFSLNTSTKELTMLFDFLKARGRQLMIVDGQLLLWRTGEMSSGLCARLGIDPTGLSDTWGPASQEDIVKTNPLVHMLTMDIQESSGTQRPESRVSAIYRAVHFGGELTSHLSQQTLRSPVQCKLGQASTAEEKCSTAGSSCERAYVLSREFTSVQSMK